MGHFTEKALDRIDAQFSPTTKRDCKGKWREKKLGEMQDKEPSATDPKLRFNKLAAANPLHLFSPFKFSVSFILMRQLVWCPTKGSIYNSLRRHVLTPAIYIMSHARTHTHSHTHTPSDALMEDSRDKGTDNRQLSAAFLMFSTHTLTQIPCQITMTLRVMCRQMLFLLTRSLWSNCCSFRESRNTEKKAIKLDCEVIRLSCVKIKKEKIIHSAAYFWAGTFKMVTLVFVGGRAGQTILQKHTTPFVFIILNWFIKPLKEKSRLTLLIISRVFFFGARLTATLIRAEARPLMALQMCLRSKRTCFGSQRDERVTIRTRRLKT